MKIKICSFYNYFIELTIIKLKYGWAYSFNQINRRLNSINSSVTKMTCWLLLSNWTAVLKPQLVYQMFNLSISNTMKFFCINVDKIWICIIYDCYNSILFVTTGVLLFFFSFLSFFVFFFFFYAYK